MVTSSLWVGVSTLCVSTFLYGIYLVLFGRCMYIFHKSGWKHGFVLPLSAVLMFVLSSVTVLLFLLQGATAYGALQISEADVAARLGRIEVAGAVVYVTNNLLADALLIYRCYLIWNTIYITIVPLLLLLATMALGYTIQLRLFFILSLTINLFVPTLVAARLWYAIRLIRTPSPAAQSTRRKGRNAMIIILESGLLYSLFVSIHMGFFHFQNPGDEIVYAALGQIVGIVPTLIIVRVGLGVCTNGHGGSGSESAVGHGGHTIGTVVGSASGDVPEKRGRENGNGWGVDTIV